MPSVAEREDVVAPSSEPVGRPVLPSQPAEGTGERETVRTVRAFCVTGADPSGRLEVPGKGVLPALMHAMRDPGRVRTGEPIVLPADGAVLAFGEWLEARIDAAFPSSDSARVLRDNALRLERAARRLAPGEASLAGLARGAIEAVIEETGLHGDGAASLRSDGGAVVEGVSEDDAFLTPADDVALEVLVRLARRRQAEAREAYESRVRDVRDRVAHLLSAETARGTSHAPDKLADAIGSPEDAIDPGALARVLGKTRGPTGMPRQRRERLAGLLEQLDAFLAEPRLPAVVVVREDGAGVGAEDVVWLASDLPCAEAARQHDALADRLLSSFLAVRVAELEVDDRYDAGVHGLFIESFDRDELSADETAMLPAIVAVETLERLCGPDMPNVAGVLLSGRPIRVLLETEPASSMLAHEDHEPLVGARFEPGLFGIGLRAPAVHQTSVAAPSHLAAGFDRALSTDRASLHVVARGTCEGGVEPTVGRWLHAGAAADGRAHPLFLYDPSAGPSWAARFDFAGNAQEERDWPEHELACVDAGGVERPQTLAFTFADFAVLEPAYRKHFRLIPDACPTGDLAPVAEVVGEWREADRRIPFVWVAGPDGAMHRAAVSRRLVEACRDRLESWRTLQQNAGIHDEYAERAAASARATAAEDADARIAALEAAHEAEIERIRREEAGTALGRLAESILGVDLSSLSTARPSRASAARAPVEASPAEPATEAEAPAEAAPEPEDDLAFDEPYVDSVLCTSCNDCMAINPRVFVYNENKQAMIGDPDAGTFAEIVAAAEKCPARCIHPGKPRNPDEPHLDELVERAKPFN